MDHLQGFHGLSKAVLIVIFMFVQSNVNGRQGARLNAIHATHPTTQPKLNKKRASVWPLDSSTSASTRMMRAEVRVSIVVWLYRLLLY